MCMLRAVCKRQSHKAPCAAGQMESGAKPGLIWLLTALRQLACCAAFRPSAPCPAACFDCQLLLSHPLQALSIVREATTRRLQAPIVVFAYFATLADRGSLLECCRDMKAAGAAGEIGRQGGKKGSRGPVGRQASRPAGRQAHCWLHPTRVRQRESCGCKQ